MTDFAWLPKPTNSLTVGIVSLRAYEKYPEHVLKMFWLHDVSPYDPNRLPVNLNSSRRARAPAIWIPKSWVSAIPPDGFEAAYITTEGTHRDQLVWTIEGDESDWGAVRLAYYSAPDTLEASFVTSVESLRQLTDEERVRLLRPFYDHLAQTVGS